MNRDDIEAEFSRTDQGPYDRSREAVEGDVVCYVGRLYPENRGKLLDVVACHAMLWVTPRRSEFDDESAPLPGIGENDLYSINGTDHGYRFSGPGEVCCVDRNDVALVA